MIISHEQKFLFKCSWLFRGLQIRVGPSNKLYEEQQTTQENNESEYEFRKLQDRVCEGFRLVKFPSDDCSIPGDNEADDTTDQRCDEIN